VAKAIWIADLAAVNAPGIAPGWGLAPRVAAAQAPDMLPLAQAPDTPPLAQAADLLAVAQAQAVTIVAERRRRVEVKGKGKSTGGLSGRPYASVQLLDEDRLGAGENAFDDDGQRVSNGGGDPARRNAQHVTT
jgi:hypothetical protein